MNHVVGGPTGRTVTRLSALLEIQRTLEPGSPAAPPVRPAAAVRDPLRHYEVPRTATQLRDIELDLFHLLGVPSRRLPGRLLSWLPKRLLQRFLGPVLVRQTVWNEGLRAHVLALYCELRGLRREVEELRGELARARDPRSPEHPPTA